MDIWKVFYFKGTWPPDICESCYEEYCFIIDNWLKKCKALLEEGGKE